MIVSLAGTVASARGSEAVIEVSGIGYLVNVTPAHALSMRIGEDIRVNTVQIVREDSLSLFGFASTDERDVFELLLSVTGVGPKSALGVLSALAPSDIAAAVAAEDDAAFRKVSGIGPKTAKLIVVSLTGKVLPSEATAPQRSAGGTVEAVVSALVGLGWAEKIARSTVEDVVATTDQTIANSVPALLRQSLTELSGGKR